jgi:eukaryotic-like serine/threonine-protein kinase
MANVESRDLSGHVLGGRYRVISPIGKGAMGSVYRSEDLRLGRVVAIKVINDHVPNEMAVRRRFDREAKAMARLEHPHCASVLDVGMHEDQPFVVMDFVSGQGLDAVVAEGPLPIGRAVAITRQVLFGLEHAHEHGIIHRDVKPANIVLSQKSGMGDHVKILDFGLARLNQETSNLTTGVVVGTPSYMAPEQIRGLVIDSRVDLYACGVLLFELLTGTKPFRSANNDPLEVCMMHLNRPVPRLAEVLPGRELGMLDDIMSQALAKDPERRFATAGAFANALAAVQVEHPAPKPVAAHRRAATPATMDATVHLEEADLVPADGGSMALAPVGRSGSRAALEPAGDDPMPTAAPEPARSVARLDAPRGEAPGPETAAPVRRPASRRRRFAFAAGAGGLALGVVVAVIAAREPASAVAPARSAAQAPDPGAEALAAPPPEAARDPVSTLVAQADTLVASGRRDAAINLLVKARRSHPGDGRIPYRAGLLYLNKMWWPDGLKQLRAAIALDPSYRTDPTLIETALRAFNATAQYDWALANFLRNDVGDAARPYLEQSASSHPNPVVRSRAAAELRRYPGPRPVE